MKLFIFNGSRTLLDIDTSVWMLLAERCGKMQEAIGHMNEYNKRKQEGPWGLEQLAALFAGKKKKELDQMLAEIVTNTLRPDAKSFVQTLQQRGFCVAFYSSELLNLTQQVQKTLGLHDILGNELEFKRGVCTGNLKKKVDRYVRAKRIEQYAQEKNLTKHDVVILGDSVTALAAKDLGQLILLNPKDSSISNKATVTVSTLSEVLAML
ncbi:MAG: haloacid dehalogenase-like hydrolase [Candidatus Aenigmarchaeota archaeon]|nr:haloacid dehalogenase-like hydrolase [Candidatus Aenigmarchaeota archaeon]